MQFSALLPTLNPLKSLLSTVLISTVMISHASADTVVGSIPAEFSVNSGQASYSIPIQVAPGRGGMQPDLSINYTGGGNGVLGVGWSLGGLSSIHRCAANLEQDGFVAGITFSSKDRYCLDGQRLVPVVGDNGAIGTEYKTEIDGYSQIKSYGGTVNNPSYWIAKTKAGQVITFGGGSGNVGSASLKFAQGVTTWSVKTIGDTTSNNRVIYTYFIDQYTQYLSQVSYPGGKVVLTYDSRGDSHLRFFAGAGIRAAQRLNAISSYSNNTKIKTYNTTYRRLDSTKSSHLSGITECNSDNECYASIELNHSYNQLGVSNDVNYILPEMVFDYAYSGRSVKLGELIDVNGDGLLDYVIAYRNPSFQVSRRTYINNGSRWVLDSNYALPEFVRDYAVSASKSPLTFGQLQDVNGDGLVDLVISYRSANRIENRRTYINTGSGWSQNVSYALPETIYDYALYHLNIEMTKGLFIDVNNDGLNDYVITYRDTSRIYHQRTYINTGNGWKAGEAKYKVPAVLNDYALATIVGLVTTGQFQDVNGDGLVDQIVAYRDTSGGMHQRTYLNSPTGWVDAPDYAPPAVLYDYRLAINVGVLQTGDFLDVNGDGLVDYVMSYRNTSGQINKRTYLNNGNGWRSPNYSPQYNAPEIMYDYRLVSAGKGRMQAAQFADMNADGLPDYVIAYRNSSGVIHRRTYLNTGSGWLSWSLGLEYLMPEMMHDYAYSGSIEVQYGLLADVNGDGRTDYVMSYRNPSRQMGARSYLSKASSPKLSSINQANTFTELEYKPLTDPTVYTKGSGAQYPVVDLIHPQYVVSSVKTNDGVGGTSTVNYHYEGLKSHVRGRGSYGYAKITESYPETGKSQETYFNQTAFPLTGNVDRVVEKLNGQVINESTKTYAVASHNGVYQLNLDQSIDNSYELNGDLVTTVTTRHRDIDAYGNIGTVEVSTSANGANGANQTFSKITHSQYTNDTTNWYLGRLSDTTVTHKAPSQADQQRRSRFTYDSNTGLLTSEAVVSTVTGLPLTTTSYQYDAYGHKTQVTVSANNESESDRTSTTVYNNDGKPTQSCNQLNQCETYTYTPEGWLASTTGPNGITTTWAYDGFGRKTQETRADGTQTTIAHHFASSGHCGVLATHAYTCSISQTTGSQPAIVQYDRLGRERRKIVTGFDGRLVYSDTEYNGLAQVTRVSRNYFMGDHIYWANSQYDLLGRVTQMDEPAPHGTRNIIKTTYNGLLTTVTSGPEQRQKTTQTNAIGQVIHRGEEEGSYVEYTYTADGNLKTTTVAGDNSTTITLFYDEFGRKIGMDDPDMGQWSYTYNAFGQLVSQTDAKGQITTMEYDVLGRMVSRTDAHGTAQAQISTWTYGDANAPQGSIGKLLSESITHPDGNGNRKDYYYDSLGRPEEATTIIDPNTPIEQSFSTQTLYDTIGRVSRTIYPGSDNFYTENLYNANGFLEKVRGLRSNSEQYDLSQLTPLVSEAIDLASDYHSQAATLRAIGNLYQAKIDQYQTLIEAGTTSGSTDTALNTRLTDHESVLSSTINTAQTDAGSFYGHLNNTVIELQTVTDIINTQIQQYDELVEQLTVLAEQTLAAADNSFQYERTLVRGSEVYTQLVNDNDYTNYWQAIDVDASGRISAEVYGNGIVNDYTYNQATGQLQHIHSSLLSIDPIRHLEYQYDAYQNVTSREDHANDIRETYEYDRLDRLTRTDITSNTYISSEFNGSQTQSYDVFGNITYKSDVGNYTYGTGIANGAGIHAVIATTPTDGGSAGNAGRSFQYDANGNMISGDGRTVQWSSFNKPTLITKGGKSAEFQYDASRSRYKKTNHKGDTIRYVGKLYEHVSKVGDASNNIPASVDEKHYIYANGQLVAEHIVSTTAGVQTRYLHKDALGSVDLITDAHANVVDRRSFDAWGKLRNLTWKDSEGINNPLYLTQLPFTNKGYTGHEHIQEVDLIHMNGRVYDATLARFMSADPHIQEGALTQSYNRYSYVMNNPLKYTDPSGYFFKKLFRAVKKFVKKVVKVVKKVVKAVKPFVGVIVGAAVGIFCQVCGGAIMKAALAGAAAGAAGAAVNGGNILKAAITGFVTGALTAGASKWIGNADNVFGARGAFDVGRSIAHGVVGGTMNVIRGGKFGVGFVSSAFTKFVSDPIQGFAEKISTATGIASEVVGAAGAALVGGTASVLGGGKFANGAATAAIQYLFNQAYLAWGQAQAARARHYQPLDISAPKLSGNAKRIIHSAPDVVNHVVSSPVLDVVSVVAPQVKSVTVLTLTADIVNAYLDKSLVPIVGRLVGGSVARTLNAHKTAGRVSTVTIDRVGATVDVAVDKTLE
ncbi:RHS repeat-associated core domain-containing protein [Eionea flava]